MRLTRAGIAMHGSWRVADDSGCLVWAWSLIVEGTPDFSRIRDKDTLPIYASAWGRLEMDGGDKIWLEGQCDPGRGISQLSKAAMERHE